MKIEGLSRLVALDYGKVRTGIAVTDDLRMIASGLGTVETSDLLSFLEDYFRKENVGGVVVGEPRQMDGRPSESEVLIQEFLRMFEKKFPQMPYFRQDERFTSKMASQSLRMGGASKKKRQNKALIDEISAVLILQAYLDHS